MSTISVPLTPELENFINMQITLGQADSKAGLIRRAIAKYEEDYYYNQVIQAQEEMRSGKIIRGDLKTLLEL